jgi:integrase/recombinase XerD
MSKTPKNLRRRGNVWWYRITHNGQTFEGSLDTEHLATAKEHVARKREELIATKWGRKPKRSFNEAAEKFGEEHFPILKPKSAQRYVVSIANLLRTFDRMLLDDITSAKLMEFERARRLSGVTSSTIRRDLACLSSIFSSAEEWEWIASNPVKPFLRGRKKKGLTEGEGRTRYLSHEEEREIIQYAPPVARDAIMVAIDTGLRKEELHALQWPWISFRAREITIPAEVTKSKLARTVPLLERSYNILKLMEQARSSEYVFVTYQGRRYSASSPYHYEALQRAVRRANKARAEEGLEPIEHLQWHDLRRTCGCRLLQDRRFSLEQVSKWLGHSSVKVTESRYAFLDVSHLHRAVAESEGKVVALHG